MELELNLKDHSKRTLLKEITNALGNHTRLTILDFIGDDDTGNLNYGGIAEKIGKRFFDGISTTLRQDGRKRWRDLRKHRQAKGYSGEG